MLGNILCLCVCVHVNACLSTAVNGVCVYPGCHGDSNQGARGNGF